jgi:hypothetical protein
MTDKQIIKVDSLDELYITQLQEQLKRKEQECEVNEDLVNEYFNKIMMLEDRNFRLKQALTKIKDIVDTCNSGVICSECPYAEECRTDTESEALGVCKLILQKFEGLNE